MHSTSLKRPPEPSPYFSGGQHSSNRSRNSGCPEPSPYFSGGQHKRPNLNVDQLVDATCSGISKDDIPLSQAHIDHPIFKKDPSRILTSMLNCEIDKTDPIFFNTRVTFMLDKLNTFAKSSTLCPDFLSELINKYINSSCPKLDIIVKLVKLNSTLSISNFIKDTSVREKLLNDYLASNSPELDIVKQIEHESFTLEHLYRFLNGPNKNNLTLLDFILEKVDKQSLIAPISIGINVTTNILGLAMALDCPYLVDRFMANEQLVFGRSATLTPLEMAKLLNNQKLEDQIKLFYNNQGKSIPETPTRYSYVAKITDKNIKDQIKKSISELGTISEQLGLSRLLYSAITGELTKDKLEEFLSSGTDPLDSHSTGLTLHKILTVMSTYKDYGELLRILNTQFSSKKSCDTIEDSDLKKVLALAVNVDPEALFLEFLIKHSHYEQKAQTIVQQEDFPSIYGIKLKINNEGKITINHNPQLRASPIYFRSCTFVGFFKNGLANGPGLLFLNNNVVLTIFNDGLKCSNDFQCFIKQDQIIFHHNTKSVSNQNFMEEKELSGDGIIYYGTKNMPDFNEFEPAGYGKYIKIVDDNVVTLAGIFKDGKFVQGTIFIEDKKDKSTDRIHIYHVKRCPDDGCLYTTINKTLIEETILGLGTFKDTGFGSLNPNHSPTGLTESQIATIQTHYDECIILLNLCLKHLTGSQFIHLKAISLKLITKLQEGKTVLFPKEANAPLPPALETNLGLGIANRREDDHYLETISKLIQKLKSLYPTQVIFGLITKENTNNGIVQVWGANEYNATNPQLGGNGQAKVVKTICEEIGSEKTKDLLIGIITAGI